MKEELTLIKKQRCFSGWVEYYSHFSSCTQTPMRFTLFRPDLSTRLKAHNNHSSDPLLLFWLSGLTCTEENFTVKAGAYAWAAEKGLVIVAPDTSPRGTQLPGEHDSYDFGSGASFYLNAQIPGYSKHYRMEDYLTQELPQLVKGQLKEEFKSDFPRMGIFGHSMGGHGALVLGLKYPHLFQSISAFAPICAPTECPWGVKAFQGYLGDNKELWYEYDATYCLEKAQARTPILIDQGTQDEFLESQLKPDLLLKVATHKKYPLELRFQEGYDHSYFFISTFIKEHLDFHEKAHFIHAIK